ncbi:glycoside hydrolase family 1 protein [Streptomyces violaceusniger]|uniref:Glycoside hydrolase family 1 n=1 Tax=Streptomyces violaceusniger (strain Tu 4113) TaxID=653045 RepID=G2P4X4_STRV4|nr:family 1 glycosylhydrolase [Streptomyces violaceusniger]AEM84151.1 glycoside hydrolase family 1 [Streptomyces violaceusniger Tu 4113]
MSRTPDLRPDFLWGASTAPHQIEGNNLNSDWWRMEHQSEGRLELSGDALDSYHRYGEDMRLLADAGLNAYRFGIEWARIEPEPGEFSKAELAHYRRMIDTARGLGLEPVVTLHHFTNPRWFADEGGWTGPTAVDRFSRYVEQACTILHDVNWVATINEPNMLALMTGMMNAVAEGVELTLGADFRMPTPDVKIGEALVQAHRAAVAVVRQHTSAKVGWTVAQQALVPAPGSEKLHAELQWAWEDLYHHGARGDDFLGVQSYASQVVDVDGIVPTPESPDNTLSGWAYRPDALGIALRHAWEVTEGIPLLVTENGIATPDDTRRIAYTTEALGHLYDAVADGVDVRGYLHWTALDNFEWGHWAPTFGLVAVDRETFERTPKPSLAWLGGVARKGGAL